MDGMGGEGKYGALVEARTRTSDWPIRGQPRAIDDDALQVPEAPSNLWRASIISFAPLPSSDPVLENIGADALRSGNSVAIKC